MTNELVREKIFLDQSVGKESTQVLLEGDIIVPDVKPDMALLLQTEPKVIIERVEISADRINFIGQLSISVLYMAKTDEKPVHTMTLSAPIDDFINMDGVSKDHWVTVKAELVNIDYKMLNDRKLNYRAVVNITACAERSDVHELVVHIHDVSENQLLKKQLNINRTVENKSDRFTVKDQISIPSSHPNIREILQCSSAIINKNVVLSAGRVSLSGELLLTTLYRGDNEERLIEFVEHEIPFSSHIDVNDALDDMFADVDFQILDEYVQVRPDSDGEDRQLELEITIGVNMKVYSSEALQILEDAYCINKKLSFSMAKLKYPKLVCRNRNQAPVKEVVQLSSGSPGMLQIFRIKGTPHIDEVKITDDKATVEGIIDTDILYVAESDDTPLYSFKTVIPYRQVIEVKGAAPDMNINVDIGVDHTSFNLLSGWETEIRLQLSFNAQVIEEQEIHVINHIDFDDMDMSELDKMASMTVYIVQNGDTLWTIAKRYNTPIDELLSINELEGHKIVPGQKLLILKKV